MSYSYISSLTKLVEKLNTDCGYCGRYTLVQRTYNSHQNWAIMKKEGALDRNVSGWGTPLQLKFWVLGHLEGYSAHARRADNQAVPPFLARAFDDRPQQFTPGDDKTRTP